MRFIIPKLAITPQYFLRKCGYIEIQNPHKNNEISYARSLDPGRFYPRFHVYLEPDQSGTGISIHMDAKKPSYEGTSAHSGEYDGPLVQGEITRIQTIMKTHASKNDSTLAPLGFRKQKSWLRKLLGL